MRYTLTYKKSVDKDLRRLPKNILQSITNKILDLAIQPRPEGSIKLQGSSNLYRIRQGDYRIVYIINDTTITVIIVKVGHRKDVYNK